MFTAQQVKVASDIAMSAYKIVLAGALIYQIIQTGKAPSRPRNAIT